MSIDNSLRLQVNSMYIQLKAEIEKLQEENKYLTTIVGALKYRIYDIEADIEILRSTNKICRWEKEVT